MKSLIACATLSNKEVNEDNCIEVVNNHIPFNGTIVADGIGSHLHSYFASNFVTKYIKNELEALRKIKDLKFDKLFLNAQKSLTELAKKNKAFNFNDLNKNAAISTTIICALETEDCFIIAYLGNGSIWHISGSFNQFSNVRYLPWNSINLLNPHCSEQNGKSALNRYISIDETVNKTPTIIQISKNTNPPGDWIMISTDGIYSYDAVIVGKDDEGKIWISGEEAMELFYKTISKLLLNKPLELTKIDLQLCLQKYLQLIRENKLMNDDCTIGVIIPNVILRYQHNINENQKDLINETNSGN